MAVPSIRIKWQRTALFNLQNACVSVVQICNSARQSTYKMLAIMAPKGTNLRKERATREFHTVLAVSNRKKKNTLSRETILLFYCSGLFVERKKLGLTCFIYHDK